MLNRRITTTALVLAVLIAFVAATPVFASGGDPAQTVQIQNSAPYAVGWGTLTLINAGLAQGKNRSGLIWFLVSIFLGPVATFLLVAFFPKR